MPDITERNFKICFSPWLCIIVFNATLLNSKEHSLSTPYNHNHTSKKFCLVKSLLLLEKLVISALFTLGFLLQLHEFCLLRYWKTRPKVNCESFHTLLYRIGVQVGECLKINKHVVQNERGGVTSCKKISNLQDLIDFQ